jgi:hypothetical protein
VIVRDLVFLALMVGFFALATLFLRACQAVVGAGADLDEHER